MQKFERTMEVVHACARSDQAHQQRRQSAAGGEGRAVLRSRRAGCDHGQHGAAQSDFRHRADISHPMDVPRQFALRDDRCGNDPGRAVPRRDHHGDARRVRQPACRSAPSISASSSTRPSSWWKIFSATWRIIRCAVDDADCRFPKSSTASSPAPSRWTSDLFLGASSPSPRSCHCSPCRASRARSSAPCRAPMPTRCWAPSRHLHRHAGAVVGPAAR